MRLRTLLALICLALAAPAQAADGNRLTYLDGDDPYYVGRDFPKLTTPQWVGEEGVEAVVVLAIDDMRDPAKYEAFLRPILDRLKRIDGRAPVSIMTNRVKPDDPRLQSFLKEGVNIDAHTLTHPCPLLQKGDFEEAARTYHECVDLLSKIPGNRPVAFRMPCCDSLNTPSPRFYAEIFNGVSPEGHFLTIDSSVFNILTPDDPTLPRELVQDPDGRERFRKYLPFRSFVNTIENYPYPYVIGELCWEFPCVVPSDWEAQHLHKSNNPKTVEDLKAALDAIVLKQGVFNLVFHPHGWIKAEQIVELIDHAVARHGKKIKFLNFREALERLDKNLLGGVPLRDARGLDNGVRLLDLDNDAHIDVVIGNDATQQTRRWDPRARRWETSALPTKLVSGQDVSPDHHHARFGVIRLEGRASMLVRIEGIGGQSAAGGWHFDGRDWVEDPTLLSGLPDGFTTSFVGVDSGVRLRDVDGDGRCELICASEEVGRPRGVFAFSVGAKGWKRLPFDLPQGAALAFNRSPAEVVPVAPGDVLGLDAGLRFVDLDVDGRDDIVFSNDTHFGIYLFESMTMGWSRQVAAGAAGSPGAIPPIVRVGGAAWLPRVDKEGGIRIGGPSFASNNGFWAHTRHLWWQNEDTAQLPDHVDRRSFNDLLKGVEPRAKSPEASLKSIRVRPGFKVELAACEPLVEDPIAFDWAPDGKLWVVEMGDYPLGADGKGKPGGAVKFLEDTNGDGRYDKATVFLDGLGFPTGVMPWKKGVLVASAPDIFYAEDRDGDGKADHREVLFTGFHRGNPQHLVNGFEYGLDGWIYAANGDSGGEVKSVMTGKAVNIQGRDFRFRPDDGALETESGQTQYGRHRDDWGRWFGNNNPNWAWQYVLSERDARRNPRYAPPDPRKMLEPDTKLYPASRTLPRFNDLWAANRTTSANSPTPYRDDLFGQAFYNNTLFVSEPVHNLVHRIVLEPDGVTLSGRRADDEQDREFLASSDNWFRPTMLKTGPDGALWIADMYRAVIEHPEWIPDDWEAKLDLRAGHDMGRIYRVYPIDQKPRPIPRLDKLDTADLVAALNSPNGWTRDTAQRLLIERGDKSAAGPLREILGSGAPPKSLVQAFWTLDGLGALTAEDVSHALENAWAPLEIAALGAGSRFLDDSPAVAEAAARLADSRDREVRFALALALGDWDDPKAGRLLARVVRRDPEDPWLRAAVLTSASKHAATILASLFADPPPPPIPPDALDDLGQPQVPPDGPPPSALVGPLFAMIEAKPGSHELASLLDAITEPRGGAFAAWQFSAMVGLLDSPAHDGVPPDRVRSVIEAARKVAEDDRAAEDDRLAAVGLLGRRDDADDRAALGSLLRPQVSSRLQQAAVASLTRSRGEMVPDLLLAEWKAYTPALRSAALDALLGREAWTSSLLSSLEDGCTPPAEIDPAHRRRLVDHPRDEIRRRSRLIFEDVSAARQEVIDRYRPALAESGDPKAGAAAFKKTCAACHRLAGEGAEVGPDLATLTDKSPESLLVALLDPNRAFEAKFGEFAVQTADGRVLTGLVAAETATGVTLRQQEGRDETILRSDIESMAASGKSLMPEGLEKDLSPRDVADLVAYLGGLGPPPKAFPGNRPETIRSGPGGEIKLPATGAEIFGEMLVFEGQYQNLGHWSSPDDRAAWSLEVGRPGRYAVWFDWACENGSQGNAYVLRVGPATLEGEVAGTGTWDDYRRAKVGEITLPAGRQRLEIRPAGRVRGALIDLRSVELRPLADEKAGGTCCDP